MKKTKLQKTAWRRRRRRSTTLQQAVLGRSRSNSD
jgi:hypothetical protein